MDETAQDQHSTLGDNLAWDLSPVPSARSNQNQKKNLRKSVETCPCTRNRTQEGTSVQSPSEQAASGTVDPGPGPQGWADPVERVLLCVAPPGGGPQARLSHQNGHGGSRLHIRAGQPQGEQATAKKMGTHAITLKTGEGTGGRHQRTPLGQKKSPNGLRRRAPSPLRAPAGRCPGKKDPMCRREGPGERAECGFSPGVTTGAAFPLGPPRERPGQCDVSRFAL